MNSRFIMLIEDNENDIKLTQIALKRSNILNKLVVLRNGVEALNYLFCRGEYSDIGINNLPSIILLDIKLPKVNGFEVLKNIRANQRTKLIPVIMLTSSNNKQDIISSYDLGCNSYIIKPIDFSKFSEIIKQLGLYWIFLNKEAPIILK